MCLYLAFSNQDRLLAEERAQVFGNIAYDSLFNIDQGNDQTRLSGIFSVFIDVPAFLHMERKRYAIRIAYIAQYSDIFLVFKELCIRIYIIQPDIDF